MVQNGLLEADGSNVVMPPTNHFQVLHVAPHAFLGEWAPREKGGLQLQSVTNVPKFALPGIGWAGAEAWASLPGPDPYPPLVGWDRFAPSSTRGGRQKSIPGMGK